MKRFKDSRKRHGASAVEFAVVLPIFIIFLLGILEFGRIIMVQQVVVNAAREGCRRAIVEDLTTAQVAARVNQYCNASGLPDATTTCFNGAGAAVDPKSVLFGEPVTVISTINYSDVAFVAPQWVAGDFQLVGRSTMRREQIQ